MQIKISAKKAREIYNIYKNGENYGENYVDKFGNIKWEVEIFRNLKDMYLVVQDTSYPYIIVNEEEFDVIRKYL